MTTQKLRPQLTLATEGHGTDQPLLSTTNPAYVHEMIPSPIEVAPTAYPIVERWATWMRGESYADTTIKDRTDLVIRVARRQECTPEHLAVDDVLQYLAGSQMARASRYTYHGSLRAWFRWLVAVGVRDDDPMDGLKRPKRGRRTAKFITTAHVIHLLNSGIRSRTRTMCLLMGYQGLRVSEVAKFRGSDIDHVSKQLRVIGKGDAEWVLPLHPLIEEVSALYGRGWWFPQYVENRLDANGGHILPGSVTTVVGRAMRRAGIPGTAHSLRHWHATEMLREGVDIRVIQQLMRHESIATTQLYTHVDDTQRREGLLLLPDVTAPTPDGLIPMAA